MRSSRGRHLAINLIKAPWKWLETHCSCRLKSCGNLTDGLLVILLLHGGISLTIPHAWSLYLLALTNTAVALLNVWFIRFELLLLEEVLVILGCEWFQSGFLQLFWAIHVTIRTLNCAILILIDVELSILGLGYEVGDLDDWILVGIRLHNAVAILVCLRLIEKGEVELVFGVWYDKRVVILRVYGCLIINLIVSGDHWEFCTLWCYLSSMSFLRRVNHVGLFAKKDISAIHHILNNLGSGSSIFHSEWSIVRRLWPNTALVLQYSSLNYSVLARIFSVGCLSILRHVL